MELWTTEQVAEATGAPYRQILDWIESGWFRPKVVGGKVRRVLLFDNGDLLTIGWFDQARRHFPREEWEGLAMTVREARANTTDCYLVAIVDDEGEEHKGPRRLEVVSSDRACDLLVKKLVKVVVALEAKEASPVAQR